MKLKIRGYKELAKGLDWRVLYILHKKWAYSMVNSITPG